jgi:hypothetical protein
MAISRQFSTPGGAVLFMLHEQIPSLLQKFS